MRSRDSQLVEDLYKRLDKYESTYCTLPGIKSPSSRQSFILQVVDSIRRVKYVEILQHRQISGLRAQAGHRMFDPIKAAVIHNKKGNFENACWLVFLAIHCGHHRKDGWKVARDIYNAESLHHVWSWDVVTDNITGFRNWLETKNKEWQKNATRGRFGAHRSYESLSGWSPNGTGAVAKSYVTWVSDSHTHQTKFRNAINTAQGEPEAAFDLLFKSMRLVHRFGRLAKFDYLCMLEKLGFTQISAGSPYLLNSTGPLTGAKLLVNKNLSVNQLDSQLSRLAKALDVNMQVIEDAVCNWQKSQDTYKPFRG